MATSPLDIAKNILLWLLIGWFVIINVLILYPSVRLLITYSMKDNVSELPARPPEVPKTIQIDDLDPKLDSGIQENLVKNMEYKVAAYTQEVSAYTQHIAAYKAYLEVKKTNNDFYSYEKVVKDVLVGLLNGVLMTFIGFAGVKATGTAFNNYLLSKDGKTPSKFELW